MSSVADKSTSERLIRWGPPLIAAALCLGTLGRWSLWQDEAFTWTVTLRDVAGMVDAAAKDRHPPLYYLIVGALHHLSDFDYVIRLPSGLAFIGAVELVRRAVTRHLGVVPGAFAAFTLALSPFAVLFAHTARMYAVLLFFGAVVFGAGLDLARGERPVRAAVAMFLGAAGAMWTHYAGFAAVAAAGGATALAALANGALPVKGRFARVGLATLAIGLAAVTFLPWATGPLQYQLANKDAPSDRTLTVLTYLFWAFDSRIPTLSWVMAALQIAGLVLAIRRRDAISLYMLVWVAAAIVAPWYASRSQPAQNPRNYIDFLPVASTLAGLALAAFPRVDRRPVVVGFAAVAAFPLADLLTRPVSPQETGTAFDYRREAQTFAAAMPTDAHALFRPAYMLTQYQRYEAWLGEAAYGVVGPDANTWLFLARGERFDPALAGMYPADCTFKNAFRVVVYAPAGPGCDAMKALVAQGSDYPPFLIEMAQRSLDAGDLAGAEGYAAAAADKLRAHPTAYMMLADIRTRMNHFETSAKAAASAAEISRAWNFPGGVSAQALTMEANGLAAIGDNAGAASARALGDCMRTAYRPYLCGIPLVSHFARAVSTTEAAGAAAAPAPAAAPVSTLPALTEPQDAAPPESAPAGATRLALWTLDGAALPDGWTVLGGDVAMAPVDAADGPAALVASATKAAATGVACGPLVPAKGSMLVRARWKAELDPGEGRTWLVLEARATDAAGAAIKAGGGPVIARPLQTPEATDWRVDRVTWNPPAEAAQARFCVKADGTVPGRARFDWIEVSSLP